MTHKYLSFTVLVLGGLVFRLILVVYGEYHDRQSPLKYTDIDYRVFSDAASFILHPTELNHARGQLGVKLDLGEWVAHYPQDPTLVSYSDNNFQPIYAFHISLYTLVGAHADTERVRASGIWQDPVLSGRRADCSGPS